MNALHLILLNGLCWGGFGLVARASGLNSSILVNVSIALGTLVAPSAHALITKTSLPGATISAVMICVAAGVVNGIGMIPYGQLIEGSMRGRWELSSVLPMALIVMVTVATIGACVCYGESFTMRKALGLLLAGTAIYLFK